MKALVLTSDQEVRLEERPFPTDIPAGYARVRNQALSLNHLDLFGYRGMAFAKRKLPIVVGVEGSCIVDAVGEGVDAQWVGRRAVVYPGHVCDACRHCLAGRETLCGNMGGIMGFHVDGLAADYSVVPARLLIEVPDGVSFHEAACATVTFGTVERMLVTNARLGAGETILVHAGGSGIGSTAIRLAKSLGAQVITTVGSREKEEAARALGADHVINYSEVPFEREARRICRGGVDVVFEHVGSDTWERSLLCLVKGGRLVTCGSTTGIYARTNLFHLFNQQITIHASFGGDRSHVRAGLARMSNGVGPVLAEVLPLADLEHGLERLRQRNVFGKLVIDLATREAA